MNIRHERIHNGVKEIDLMNIMFRSVHDEKYEIETDCTFCGCSPCTTNSYPKKRTSEASAYVRFFILNFEEVRIFFYQKFQELEKRCGGEADDIVIVSFNLAYK